ncbi:MULTISPECIES: hypothetical protein [Hyphomicrobiales]|jgi:hypothetical protein|uniref:hypothetical protein n=1 Tax=Methylobacterium sp. CCH7-A2 TaxID=1768789 RepID=UPI00082AC029|nr:MULTISPECIES: hypothetical protein [Hyphomicrobiales]
MATITQVLADRATAGSRYADAVTELKAAYIALAAIDMALDNNDVPTPGPQRPVRGFGPLTLDELPLELVHPVYQASRTHGWRKEIIAAAEPIIKTTTAA